jgi:flagellar basal-body rod protein FlgC
MSRQQKFIEVISENIANAETTRTEAGGPYKRQIAVGTAAPNGAGIETRVVEDATPGRAVYDPGHPDADDTGYVRYPNVDLATETVDLMIARRMHEANATVFQAAKAMLKRAMEI